MPPPIYVAVGCAVIGIAAVIAFKEFVYDPHVAPQIEEWKERRRQRRRGPVEVPVRSRSPDDRTPFGRRGNNSDDKGSGDENSNDEHNADDGMSFELRDLRARETAEWSSTNTQNTLRQRRGRSGNVLDESNVFVPYDPISPIPLSATDSSAPSSPFAPRIDMAQVSTSPVIHSPLPRPPISTSKLQSSVTAGYSSFTIASTAASTAAASAVTSPRVTSPASSTRSGSTASSFTPAVIGPPSRAPSARYGTPQTEASVISDIARSPTFSASSPPRSRAISPFVAVPGMLASAVTSPATHASAASPFSERALSPLSPFSDFQSLSPGFRSPSPVLLSPQGSSLTLAETSTAVLSPSLRSGMFSPSMSFIDDDEIASFDGSEFDNWSSVGRRTPSPDRL